MTKKIFCTFLQCEKESQDSQPFPGELGKLIYDKISQEAWKQWQHKQTILINEKNLNMTNKKHRQLLRQEMLNFLFKNKKFYIKDYTTPEK